MKALVTGGGGFLGRFIVERLRAQNDDVTVLARGSYPDLERLGVRCARGDIADRAAVRKACEGRDTVFHVAARVGFAGSREDFWASNVAGTDNVLEACREAGVRKLVFTSSPSVIFDGHDQAGLDESTPYPASFLALYPETKAESERRVLAANGIGGLTTTALRPHIIFGPRDASLLPRLVDRARRGQLLQVGDGSNLVDVVYVENAAEAHMQAAASEEVAGKAYFITQGQPVRLWDFIGDLLKRLDLPGVRARIPFSAAYALGAASEATYRALGLAGEPRMTRFLACELAHSHYYSIERARRDFGYTPRVSTAEGLDRLAAWWKTQQ
ncbi:MAG: NAD-dependent epimerase/dehydratase family protein [Candidatus Wallbacteria bacterium]|nr:NAD-dependent epimerase/dehydratase family protein [Candidatus Wallbacteria bacterium]